MNMSIDKPCYDVCFNARGFFVEENDLLLPYMGLRNKTYIIGVGGKC